MEIDKSTGGYIFDIQGFSVHDGPGCRTLIFLKGCSLRCSWCSNPEGINFFPEPLYNAEKCIYDKLCVSACKKNAIYTDEVGIRFRKEICRDCSTFECVKECCTGAIRKCGYYISAEQLLDKIKRDRQYWGGNGGITLTGGEPLCQPEFAETVLRNCFETLIHTGIETCGNVKWASIESLLDFIEWIFYDIKHLDSDKHKEATSSGNELIIENAVRLAEKFKGRMIFRMPIVSGFNDDIEHIKNMCEFIKETGRREINILPLHRLGREKYKLVGLKFKDEFKIPGKEELLNIKNIFESSGIKCFIGSDTPF
ncbi:MAG: glycyl-radical enzyme activating protein [Ignavibacteria bacterium]|nr:glycyl-radical enzyme activating protein [Ignavibacteria bacterium]